ncbi:MAG TPA: hypothetical protein VGD78_06070 [Chthoniobacterales bacterium]
MPRKPRPERSHRRPTDSAGHRRGQPRRGALITLDTESIRKNAFQQIQKQRKALEKETQILDRFLHADQPSYFRWLASVAGDLLTQVREAESELEHLENLVAGVQRRVWMQGITPQRAYRELRAAEAHRAKGERAGLDESDNDAPPPPGGREDRIKGEFSRFVDENIPEDLRGSFRDEVRRFSRAAFGEDLSWLMDGNGRPEPASGLEVQLKTLYRQMVGILHPDRRDPKLNQDLCTELWHDLQQAYHSRDLERLRTVYARVEYSLGVNTPQQTTVWELRAEVDNLRVALRAVKSEIKEASLEPGWKFSARKDLDAFAVQVKRQLKQETRSYKEEAAALRELIEGWAAGPRSRRKPSRRTKATWPQTSDLF